VLTVYYSVAAAMLIRFLLGWCGAARMTRASEPVSPPRECLAFMRSGEELDIRESRLVVAPVTVGVLVPTILLPVMWTHWSREKLRAVLAHEVAHIQRRDLLVAFIAHLNRCLLWFHPLSWWLERTLAATAEQASDDIALSVVGARARYAGILLDMAREVSHEGGRISWLGVGIDGSGSLSQRVNRVLSAEVVREMSRVRTGVLAVSCISAIFLGAACGPSSASRLTLPVLIAFSVLLSAVIELRGAPFFRWIHDLDQ
jgi:beta-lactamase regulating signal transducer with metallopeptidase domain